MRPGSTGWPFLADLLLSACIQNSTCYRDHIRGLFSPSKLKTPQLGYRPKSKQSGSLSAKISGSDWFNLIRSFGSDICRFGGFRNG
jgi:hypothetical protein